MHRTGPTAGTLLQHFELELRAHGTARVTSGMGDDGRPIPVPARIGVSGSQASMVLNRDSFARGQRDWDSKERPPLRKFGFSASAAAAVGEEKSVIDQLGPESSSTFRYPDGMPCPAEGCY